MTEQNSLDQEAMSADWEQALQEQGAAQEEPTPAESAGTTGPTKATTQDGYRSAELENLRSEPSAEGGEVGLDAILDIPVTLAMEIGRTQISIRNLLQLNQGSVVELDRLAGEPLDVLVNGTLIAHGEVVVVNEKFGIRLTDVMSAQERVQKLR